MSDLTDYLKQAVDIGASDLFLVAGGNISCKAEGQLTSLTDELLTSTQSQEYLRQIYEAAHRDISILQTTGDDDFTFAVPGLARFRVNAFRQRGSLAAVIRVVAFSVPDWQNLHLPEELMKLSELTSGMVLFVGTAGCGKSTSLACLIDQINQNRACHIITLEDPIEYLHKNKRCIISQREVSVDTKDYLSALRSCLRQAPDVIQLGEMRDLETIRTAMTAAETGHLLLATLHTRGAVNTIDRIIDIFPADQQNQIRIQLSGILHTVVSQQLLPAIGGKQIPAFEIMHMTDAIRSMIREGRNHQIAAAIASGSAQGMLSMDKSIENLYKQGFITRETALGYAENPEQLIRHLDT